MFLREISSEMACIEQKPLGRGTESIHLMITEEKTGTNTEHRHPQKLLDSSNWIGHEHNKIKVLRIDPKNGQANLDVVDLDH